MKDPFYTLLTKLGVKGWLRDYVELVRYTESPASFKFFTAAALLSAVLRRKVYVDKGTHRIYPPLPVMLVGPAGVSKKSTAARFGKEEILSRMSAEGQPHPLPASGSPEAFIDALNDINQRDGTATGLLVVSELANCIGKQDYNAHMAELLLDVFDNAPINRKTKSGGHIRIPEVGVSAVLCSNEHLLLNSVPATVIQSGFASRVIMIYETFEPARVADPEDYMVAEDEKTAFAQRLDSQVFKFGIIRPTAAAKKWQREWYDSLRPPAEESLAPLYSRLQNHLYRLAILLTCGENENDPQPQIELHHFKQAKGILDYVMERIPSLYELLATDRFGADYKLVYRMLERRGGEMMRKELGRKLSHRMNYSKLQDVLSTMYSNGDIDMGPVGRDYLVKLRFKRL